MRMVHCMRIARGLRSTEESAREGREMAFSRTASVASTPTAL